MRKILLITICLAAAVIAGRSASNIKQADIVLSKGGTMAWARHVTGQDTDEHLTWDDFRSVAVIPGGSGEEDEIWVVVDRVLDGNDYKFIEQFQPQDFGDQNDAWFVDAGLGGTSNGVAETPATSVDATYKFTRISEVAAVWDIPIGDGELGITMTGVARDIGGGKVGLPVTAGGFVAGDTVRITNTTNYEVSILLEPETTSSELVITHGYVAETFDGTEVIVRAIGSLDPGGGDMVQDSDGNLWIGHNWNAGNSTFITKIATDGTLSYDDLNNSWDGTGTQVMGMAINADSSKLWLYYDNGRLEKWDLATGNEDWNVKCGIAAFDISIDTSGNCYFAATDRAGTMIDAAVSVVDTDGNLAVTGLAGGIYASLVDDDNGFACFGGSETELQSVDPAAPVSNLFVVALDLASSTKIALGGVVETVPPFVLLTTYIVGTGHIAIKDGFIYVIVSTPTPTIYKVQVDWSGSQITGLTVVTSVAGPTYGTGLYFDLYGNLVVVNQSAGGVADILYFYDTDLNQLSFIDNMYVSILTSWASPVGGSWIQGNAVFDGALAVPGNPIIPGTDPNYVGMDHFPVDVNLCVYADGVPIGNYITEADANGTIVLDLGAEYDTVIAGINYYSIYESFPMERKRPFSMIKTQKASITNIRIDLKETLAVNLGVSLDNYSQLSISEDDFATRVDMYTGPMIVTFPRGTSREPIVYMWEWLPVPWSMRGYYATLNVNMPGEE